MREPKRQSSRYPDRAHPRGIRPGREASNLLQDTRQRLLFATVLALAAILWLHVVLLADGGPVTARLPVLALDTLLAIPFAGAAVWAAGTRRRERRAGTGPVVALVARGAPVAIAFTLLFVPLSVLLAYGHALLGVVGAPPTTDLAGLAELAGGGIGQALQVWPAVLVTALLAVAASQLVGDRRARRRLRARLRSSRRPAAAVATVAALVAGVGVVVLLPASPATAQTGGCQTAPRRTYEVAAINVEITVNRHGDNDPFGFMYVLQDNLPEVRAFEAALREASATEDELDAAGDIITPWPERVAQDAGATLVSSGLRQDPIQPLVLRARLGECVVIHMRNDLARPPVGGNNNNNSFEFPGGVPRVSIDMQGVSYNAQGGQGGQAVGNTGGSVMAQPGQTVQYEFFLDPLMGEGTKVFRSGGDSTQLTAHGLFGALIAEPAGARWFDPETGQERTGDAGWSNWEAMVQAPGQPTFREFAILYHEIGDEDFNLRRPLREPFGGGVAADPFDPSPSPRLIGGSLPMVDSNTGVVATPFNTGGATTAYRPGSRAINYRSESFFRRLQHETLLVAEADGDDADAAREQLDNKSLSYSSYTYGDPATPIARSYLGEPTKTRLAHVGFEQLHVHHLHGGATRWRQNPEADNTDMASGLRKVPIQNAQSVRLDSQTISPEESFTLEHECGAGGCQQAVGDFLYHCHIAHHYIAGMWGIWRVFDTQQVDLATLPGRAPAPQAVTSAALLGQTLSDGRTVVLDSQVTDPNTQVGLESLVASQLPPPGERIDKQDATVWDWLQSGPPTQPLFVGEPDDERVWENYRSPTPGERQPIRFNPVNGRPAYPLFEPHLGQRPPFAGGEHSGAPYLGNTATADRPDGVCPQASDVREYDVTAVSIDDRHPDGGIRMTEREVDNGGMLFVLNDDKDDLLNGAIPADPLVIRSNVGDCTAVTFGNEIDNERRVTNDHKVLAKTNMHTHFVQFDPQGSDGVITGFNYEQSVFAQQREDRALVSVNTPDTITVSHVDRLRPGIAIAVGVGTPDIEVRTIESIDGNTLTLDRDLDNGHQSGVPVSVEFTQYRWYSDVDSGTVFWHDHVDGIISWANGLFAAHIIEPPGSTYHDPQTGEEVDSGTIVDIHAPGGASVGVGQSGSFREFMIFLHNGRAAASDDNNRKFGQECEEGSINLRAAPFGERVPGGTLVINDDTDEPLNVDPATTDQRFEFNGARCRNAYTRDGDPADQNAGTTQATVTAVDPYVFSSMTYGEPMTPLLRAYVGDDVVIRTLGIGERGEALRMQGHRFRMERFNPDGRLMDTAVTGISERFDYVLDGGAGGPGGHAGDYLYYSTRTFALESGAWGIFRVHDTTQGDLRPLPGDAPPSGQGFPILSPNQAANPQANPGPAPPAPDPGVVSDTTQPCPSGGQTTREYDVTAFDHALPTAPFEDGEGIVYALTADVAAIRSGVQPVEPLVLRANQGNCVVVNLLNQIDPASLYGGTRAGFDLGQLVRNPQLSGGAAVGLNPDTTVAAGEVIEYRFLADQEVGTTIFQNLGSPASLRHGAYGLLIVEPAGSQWFDGVTGEPLGTDSTATQAVIDPPGSQPAFREFALTLQTTDQHYSRSIVEYVDVVAGNGINAPRGVNQPEAPVPGAPPGTADNVGTLDKAYNHVSYRSEPLTARIGLTSAPGPDDSPSWSQAGFEVAAPYHNPMSSLEHDDPATPIFRAIAGDRVVFRLGVGASDQLHSFVVSGHMYPLEPEMWNGTTDRRSQLMTSRTLTAGQTLDAWLVGGAGGPQHHPGDYAYRDSRQPWTAAGIWGILRVQVVGSGGIMQLP